MLCSGLSPTQESRPLLKNAIGKTRMRVFLLFHYFFDYTKREVNREKNRHAGFSSAFFQTACDSCVGDKPEQSTPAQEKCDSR
ncbi:hypothetical protein Mlab_0915 [Methanocorpusculum labreanum Z]|uniref:Uncharacterized protein n=1 Tax=Methanocorpusculum labreanum (strain ATCC 43576 / DSM 4855 / Z) TaxID=410358 RepID=A2SRY0_METLZ|nr:hypothetical protein Mlab_0915 [Methanocorpusculum labreanum Z]